MKVEEVVRSAAKKSHLQKDRDGGSENGDTTLLFATAIPQGG